METGIVRLSHRPACLYWASWYSSHSTNGIVYSGPGEAMRKRCCRTLKPLPMARQRPLGSHVTLPFLMPTGPVLVAWPAPPLRHITSHCLPEETNNTDGTQHTHTCPLRSSWWQRGWGQGQDIGHTGDTVKAPCCQQQSSSSCTYASFFSKNHHATSR